MRKTQPFEKSSGKKYLATGGFVNTPPRLRYWIGDLPTVPNLLSFLSCILSHEEGSRCSSPCRAHDQLDRINGLALRANTSDKMQPLLPRPPVLSCFAFPTLSSSVPLHEKWPTQSSLPVFFCFFFLPSCPHRVINDSAATFQAMLAGRQKNRGASLTPRWAAGSLLLYCLRYHASEMTLMRRNAHTSKSNG